MSRHAPVPYNAAVLEWLDRHGLAPAAGEHPDWGLTVGLSTAPLSHWLASKSKIAPDALWLGLSVHRIAGWRALVETRDRGLTVDWHPTAGLEVRSPSLIHRRRTPWPAFGSIDDLPAVVQRVGELLGKPFCRRAQVRAYSLKGRDLQVLFDWLRPVCDGVDFTLGQLHGAVPAQARCTDRRARGAGLSITMGAEAEP